jgi:hypothetical protein
VLDRKVVQELLDERLKELGTSKPKDITRGALVEAFCKFVEDDYYEWIEDNFQSFFDHGNPDWDWIKAKIEYYSKD